MSKKVDRILEEDINRTYKTSITFEDIEANIGETNFFPNPKSRLFCKTLKKLLVTSLIFFITLFNVLFIKESGSVYNINMGLYYKIESVANNSYADHFIYSLIDSENSELPLFCDRINLRPTLIISNFENIRISIYCGIKYDSSKSGYCYLAFIEYGGEIRDTVTITVHDTMVIQTDKEVVDMMYEEECDEHVSDHYVEFSVMYRNVSKKFCATWNGN